MKYAEALHALAKTSSRPSGPTNAEARGLNLNVPDDWLSAILSGWAAYYARYDKPYFAELAVANKPVRFLRIGLIPPLRLANKPCCTLCGLAVLPPKRSWHAECYEAFRPHTARAWKENCRKIKKSCKGRCQVCGIKPTRHQFDHVVALALGGGNDVSNIRLLCIPCHQTKTKADVALWRKGRPSS